MAADSAVASDVKKTSRWIQSRKLWGNRTLILLLLTVMFLYFQFVEIQDSHLSPFPIPSNHQDSSFVDEVPVLEDLDISANITISKRKSSSPSTSRRKKKRKVIESVVSMSDMEDILFKNRASPNSQIPVWVTTVDNQMLQAKSEIENAPILTKDDEQLYEPIFRNLSTFKR